ncbi:hypothetical protein P280DRAFT_320369 [Massarina eburnea CBS 473.64]|uniref:Uncharacterized protein n=1 Tax=Massarina eburnea CBS 473.64 TaxID=1395130 RepID=A0A6A6RZ51_9PLEO|nr:hypothetical protein P280DRAFT_320369 [Massarina eburnea CBS 473.64]
MTSRRDSYSTVLYHTIPYHITPYTLYTHYTSSQKHSDNPIQSHPTPQAPPHTIVSPRGTVRQICVYRTVPYRTPHEYESRYTNLPAVESETGPADRYIACATRALISREYNTYEYKQTKHIISSCWVSVDGLAAKCPGRVGRRCGWVRLCDVNE